MKLITQTRFILSCIAVSVIPTAHADIVDRTFEVHMTVLKSCAVTAGSGSNIDLGAVAASYVNATSSNTISVNCSKTTPYFIGLSPSVINGGDSDGAGAMAAVGAPTNTDTIPYQLTTDGTTIWGNTATTTSVGNGVQGTGTGLAETYTVHATAASANFTPGDYMDTVTVNVNY